MDKIDDLITRGVANIIPSKDLLLQKLKNNEKLNIYAGFDATAPKLHLGHTVPFRKLQGFAELGHNVTFLIGDFTTLIGDTSDKETERPVLTEEEIKKNLEDYMQQAGKILDFTRLKVEFNSKWLSELSLKDLIRLAQNYSAGEFVGRELIKKRLESGKRVGLHELLYPVLQGFDHYHMDTDIQIGATDQTFNMQAGRVLQKNLRNKETFVITLEYLTGTDGTKMSKSIGNCIWLTDSANDIYSKIMSITDELITQYFTLATTVALPEINKIKHDLENNLVHPMDVKKKLALEITKDLHDEKEAEKAQDFFIKTFQEKTPEYSEEIKIAENLAKTIVPKVTNSSLSEAKRLIFQNAVSINGQKVKDPTRAVQEGDKIQIGTRIFLKAVK